VPLTGVAAGCALTKETEGVSRNPLPAHRIQQRTKFPIKFFITGLLFSFAADRAA
jgi:hypothetical protein